jgi:hypothetical protein
MKASLDLAFKPVASAAEISHLEKKDLELMPSDNLLLDKRLCQML